MITLNVSADTNWKQFFPSNALKLCRFSFSCSQTDAQSHHETTSSESLLRPNHSVLGVTVLLCNRNVCACLSSICGSICFILCSLSVCQHLATTHFKCYFYLNTQWELGMAAYFCTWGLHGCSKRDILSVKQQQRKTVKVWTRVINGCPLILTNVHSTQKKKEKEVHQSVSCRGAHGNHLC